MSKYVPEVLNFNTLTLMFIQDVWGEDISSYLNSNASSFSYDIEVKYSKLFALDIFDDWENSKVASYLNSKLSNEFTKIFNALTIQYKPWFNYYRTIVEKNSGADTHTYTGEDSEKTSGNDTYSGTLSITATQNTVEPSDTLVSNSTFDDTNVLTMKPTTKREDKYNIRGKEDDSYNDAINYGKTTTSEYGKVLEMDFGRRVDTEIEGLNGIFSPQDLIKKEIILRIHYRLFDIFSNMLMMCVTSGIWDVE